MIDESIGELLDALTDEELKAFGGKIIQHLKNRELARKARIRQARLYPVGSKVYYVDQGVPIFGIVVGYDMHQTKFRIQRLYLGYLGNRLESEGHYWAFVDGPNRPIRVEGYV